MTSTLKGARVLLTISLPFDCDIRQWSHPLRILLHCFRDKLNNKARGQFEFDLTWFCFCFDFVRSHARCTCYSIFCLRFQVVQIKQVGC